MEIKQYLLSPGQWKIFRGVKIENTETQMLRVVCIYAEGIVSFQIRRE